MKMRTWAFLAVLVFIGALAWGIFSRLSSDAVSMVLGMFFGALAMASGVILAAGVSRREGSSQPPIIFLEGRPARTLSQADSFYYIEPAHSREIVQREGRR